MFCNLEFANLGQPHEVRTFAFGRIEIYHIGGLVIGRAVYEPGWRWSEHIGRSGRTDRCEVAHIGLVLAGAAMVQMADGTEHLMTAGELFAIPPGHDSWVVGDESYASLHILGAGDYERSAAAPRSQLVPDTDAQHMTECAPQPRPAGGSVHRPPDGAGARQIGV